VALPIWMIGSAVALLVVSRLRSGSGGPLGCPRILAVAVAASIVIEVLQWLLDIGRVSSVDDVIVNAAGAGLAAAASRRWWAREVRNRDHATAAEPVASGR
jgi:glycopeptide antibiotics resistance protein